MSEIKMLIRSYFTHLEEHLTLLDKGDKGLKLTFEEIDNLISRQPYNTYSLPLAAETYLKILSDGSTELKRLVSEELSKTTTPFYKRFYLRISKAAKQVKTRITAKLG